MFWLFSLSFLRFSPRIHVRHYHVVSCKTAEQKAVDIIRACRIPIRTKPGRFDKDDTTDVSSGVMGEFPQCPTMSTLSSCRAGTDLLPLRRPDESGLHPIVQGIYVRSICWSWNASLHWFKFVFSFLCLQFDGCKQISWHAEWTQISLRPVFQTILQFLFNL